MFPTTLCLLATSRRRHTGTTVQLRPMLPRYAARRAYRDCRWRGGYRGQRNSQLTQLFTASSQNWSRLFASVKCSLNVIVLKMSEKRKRVVLGLPQKLEIIKRLRKGESATLIAPIYGIGRTTVNDIKRDADKIESHVSKMQTTDGDVKVRKTMKPAKLQQLDTVMYQWFVQARSQGIPLSGPIVMIKAVEMNKNLGGDPSFKASIGWLDKFKRRHGIRQLDISGEKLSADSAVIAEYRDKLLKEINERHLSREQVYNCDETGLNWKALPDKTLASLSEKSAPGFKMQKDRITAMVCANASGSHRFPLLIVGKSIKPRSFKNLNLNALPVQYYAQKNAWMSQDIFQDWFHKMFVPKVKSHLASKGLPQEAMLLMDNAPTHPSRDMKSDDGKITCHFLPANTTSLVQPMDQGIIESMKRRYRKGFIQKLVSAEQRLTVKDFWKSYTIKDAIFGIAEAWYDVPDETLKNGWNKLWPVDNMEAQTITELEGVNDDEEFLQLLETIPGGENVSIEEVNKWLKMDKHDGGFEILNDHELIQNVVTTDDHISEDEDDAAFEASSQIISHSEAETMFSKCIEWFEQQEEADATQLLLLRTIRNTAAKKARGALRQKKMTDFFKS